MFSKIYKLIANTFKSIKLFSSRKYNSISAPKRELFEKSIKTLISLWVCVPGILIMLSVPGILLYPDSLVFFAAAVIFSSGAVLAVVAYKLILLKNQVDSLLANFKGSLFVQAVQVGEDSNTGNGVDDKKVVFH